MIVSGDLLSGPAGTSPPPPPPPPPPLVPVPVRTLPPLLEDKEDEGAPPVASPRHAHVRPPPRPPGPGGAGAGGCDDDGETSPSRQPAGAPCRTPRCWWCPPSLPSEHTPPRCAGSCSSPSTWGWLPGASAGVEAAAAAAAAASSSSAVPARPQRRSNPKPHTARLLLFILGSLGTPPGLFSSWGSGPPSRLPSRAWTPQAAASRKVTDPPARLPDGDLEYVDRPPRPRVPAPPPPPSPSALLGRFLPLDRPTGSVSMGSVPCCCCRSGCRGWSSAGRARPPLSHASPSSSPSSSPPLPRPSPLSTAVEKAAGGGATGASKGLLLRGGGTASDDDLGGRPLGRRAQARGVGVGVRPAVCFVVADGRTTFIPKRWFVPTLSWNENVDRGRGSEGRRNGGRGSEGRG